jgi:leader peptidase (prepilin peptidase)/N-methyltransferase
MWIDSLLRIGLILTLLYLARIDLRTFLLPNRITYSLIGSGLAINTFTPFALVEANSAWLGALLGYGLLFLINQAYKRIRRHDGIGMGDAKLLAGLGAWLGTESVAFILMTASLFGIVGGALWLKYQQLPRNHPFPFGPFLAITGIIEILWSSQLVQSMI